MTSAGAATRTIEPRGPFSLAEAARFFQGWRSESQVGEVLPLALVADDMTSVAGVSVRNDNGSVICEVTGSGDPDLVLSQVARIFSLDHDATTFADIGKRDPVFFDRLAAAPGFRPVLFNTPYEAGIWAILSQRVSIKQAASLRAKLATDLGERVVAGGDERPTAPTPAALLAARTLPSGLPQVKVERLRSLAEAGRDGRLDAPRLRALGEDAARSELLELPGIGPFSADLILLRGVGLTDVASLHEPRLRASIAQAYDIADTDDDIAAVFEGWRPWRTWASVLFRATAEARAAG
jgi:DNA-3-methyladenine glycosylase II